MPPETGASLCAQRRISAPRVVRVAACHRMLATSEPRLEHAPLGAPRFVARGGEVHTAVFELWNLLDRNMALSRK